MCDTAAVHWPQIQYEAPAYVVSDIGLGIGKALVYQSTEF